MPGAGDGVPEAGGFRFGEVSRQIFDGVAGGKNADFGEFEAEGHGMGAGLKESRAKRWL